MWQRITFDTRYPYEESFRAFSISRPYGPFIDLPWETSIQILCPCSIGIFFFFSYWVACFKITCSGYTFLIRYRSYKYVLSFRIFPPLFTMIPLEAHVFKILIEFNFCTFSMLLLFFVCIRNLWLTRICSKWLLYFSGTYIVLDFIRLLVSLRIFASMSTKRWIYESLSLWCLFLILESDTTLLTEWVGRILLFCFSSEFVKD